MAVSGIYVANDGVLGVVAPIGMAAAVGTCLVVDLCEGDPTGGVTLATLVRDGPSSEQLRPKRRGVSFLRNGGIAPQDAGEVVRALCGNWPNVVLRVGASDELVGEVGAVTVRAILSGPFVAEPEVGAVLVGFLHERAADEKAARMARARRLSIRLMIPLTLLILPGWVLLFVGPPFVQGIADLVPTFSGL